MSLRAVIFDLDGTVVENAYDWRGIREELGTGETSILHYLDSLPEPERSRKWAILERHESSQTAVSVLRRGMKILLEFLRGEGVRTALVTNNSRTNTAFLLKKFGLAFDLVLTRESGLWKPSGAPFRHVMQVFDVSEDECCVVGDTRFDILAAMDAGIAMIFLISGDPEKFAGLPVEVLPSVESLQARLAEFLAGPAA